MSPQVHMVCRECGSVDEQAQDLAAQRDVLLQELTECRRSNAGLRQALAEAHQEDIPRGDIKFVFQEWRNRTGRTSRTNLDDKRVKLISAAIRRHGIDMVLAAIRAAGERPYHYNYERQAVPKNPNDPYEARLDELDNIIGDATKTERNARLARQIDLQRFQGPLDPPPIVAHFKARYGPDQVLDARDLAGELLGEPYWLTVCPLHNATELSEAPLKVEWSHPGPVCVITCLRGCEQGRVEAEVEAWSRPMVEQLGLEAA